MAAQLERREAYCTLLMSDDYLPGAMVLGHSLRDKGTKKQLVAFVTLDTINVSTLDELKKLYDWIIPVDRVVNKSPANLYLMNRPDLISTFTKIALWRQTQFNRLVYIDADVVALRAPDELFNIEATFAAAPDIGWPDCFNSGVLYLKPDLDDYYALLALAQRGVSFDGADQGLLNTHFRDWHRLSFTYNCTPSGNYQYIPAYRHFQSSISLVHFIGRDKPWIVGREGEGGSEVYEELLGRWWSVYDKHYRAQEPPYVPPLIRDESRNVQQYVKDEAPSKEHKHASEGSLKEECRASEASTDATEIPLSEQNELVEEGETEPLPTAQQRRYSAQWDPIHDPPPTNSRPEAPDFPTVIYEMSEDPSLFQPPVAYPEPPKGMYYQVPATAPAEERLIPIFPWETSQSTPIRVFADEITAPLFDEAFNITVDDKNQAPSETTDGGQTSSVTSDDYTQAETISPPTPVAQADSPKPFASYSRTNAWDEVPEIERYIANLPQNRREKPQILFSNPPAKEGVAGVGTPKHQKHPSMKLTDFPTEIERPSLPVTPAPVRRPSFWSEERDIAGALPGAEGVPDQLDWNPVAKLEELQRRQSEVVAQGPKSPTRTIPDRQLLGSAASVPTTRALAVVPSFGDVDYVGTDVSRLPRDEISLGPIETTG